MRVLRWPDAFPAGDVALHKALGVQQHKNPARAAAGSVAGLAPLAQLCGDARLGQSGSSGCRHACACAAPIKTISRLGRH
jgi:hypothetical protein